MRATLNPHPPQDGHATVEMLRHMGFRGAVIGVTGNALAEDRLAFESAGANGVVVKPVRQAALESTLASVGFYLPKGALANGPSGASSASGSAQSVQSTAH